jgi:hypothetical protein
MKKSRRLFSVLALALVAAVGIFAQEGESGMGRAEDANSTGAFSLSAGAGGYIGGDFGGGAEASVGDSYKTTAALPYFGGGGYLFLDATYAELSFGIYGGGGKAKQTMEIDGESESHETDMSITNLNIGLLGKYPFAINDKLLVFPLLGIDYQITTAVKIDGKDYEGFDGDGGPGDFSALWFKLGGGLDCAITSKAYLRCEALYGIRLANKAESDMKDQMSEGSGGSADTKTLLGHGLTVKLAVGYKF